MDYPQHSYFEVVIHPHKDSVGSIIASIFQKLYPPHLHSYSTETPAFVHMQTGTILHSHKTYAENGIIDVVIPADIRIRLQIHVLPLSQLP